MASTNRMASPSDTLSTQRAETGTLLSAFEGVISNEDAEKQTERLIQLYRTGGSSKKDGRHSICILHDDRKWQHLASDVNVWYRQKELPCHVQSYCEEGWFDKMQRLSPTHYLFLGLPPFDRGKKRFVLKRPAKSPVDSSQAEAEFFAPATHSNLRLNNIVVVLPEKISTKREYRQKVAGHYLECYVKLDGQKQPSVLAASALGIFAAPQPKPLESDKAYWSVHPKLVEDFRVSSEVSLGLTIMTREMTEGAPFTRIVLINNISSNYRYEFYSRVGRYTHIQSINGILLDGLDIEKVTDVFKKLPDHHVQMMVRYIHMGDKDSQKDENGHERGSSSGHPSPLRELPNRQSTFSTVSPDNNQPSRGSSKQKVSPAESLVLPLPLFILGDNYILCKQLYSLLSEESSLTPDTAPRNSLTENGGLARIPQRSGQLPPVRSLSVPSETPSYQREKEMMSTSRDANESVDDILTPLVPRPTVLSTIPETERRVRKRSNFKGISSSDKFVQRAEMPTSKFEKLPDLQDSFEMDMPVVTSPLSPGTPQQQKSPETLPQHQFILHLPLPELDRLMTHLYFKPSGVYMVVVGLEDLIDNPLCQYENLFYWINLIHTYVSPDVKRVFVVGLYNRSTITQQHVIESVKILNKILDTYRQTVKIPLEEQGYIYLFDLENSTAECQYLCSCILNCTRLFAKSSYYFAQEFHNYVFSPFPTFQRIASDIGLNNDRALLESKFAMGQRFNSLFDPQQQIHLPVGYYETLGCYSTACISRHCDDCLLIPSVIPDLLNFCARLSAYDTQIFYDPQLRNLPLCSIHMLRHGFQRLYPNNTKDFEMIIWWMEQLNIIYTVGKGKLHGDEKFFVPFLLQYHLSDRPMYEWDEEKIETMFKDATVLYAQFSLIPMTVHLFNKILAYILKSVLKEGAQTECYVNPDSPEVVLPLYDDIGNDEWVCLVLVRYLPIQNIVEFQAQVNNRLKFLHVVENKLSKAFLGSKYYNRTLDFNRVVTFHVPAEEFTRETTKGTVWDLAQLESSQDNAEEHLVGTSHLTEPGNRTRTSTLRQWADKDPEMKTLPSDLAHLIGDKLNFSEHWVKFAVHLELMTTEGILRRKQRHYTGDPGAEALQKWKDSSCTLDDLAKCLRMLRLDQLADRVESFIRGDETPGSVSRPSKILEKKLPTEFFLELAKALNQDDKWASLGGYLNLLRTSEIEALRQKHLVDKGEHVLQLWTDSHLTYQDLINGLLDQRVGLKYYVRQIEDIIKSHNAQM